MTKEELSAGIVAMDAKILEFEAELVALNKEPGKPNQRLKIERVEQELRTAREQRRRLGADQK